MLQPEDTHFVRNILIMWVVTYIILLALATRAESAESGQYHLLDLEKMDLRYSQLDPQNRDPYAPQYTGRWQDRTSLQWRLAVLEVLYWDNDFHLETIDTGVVKTVGWHWEAGVRISKNITVFQEHHSRHILDEEPSIRQYATGNQFPVENSIGVRIRLVPEIQGRGLFH